MLSCVCVCFERTIVHWPAIWTCHWHCIARNIERLYAFTDNKKAQKHTSVGKTISTQRIFNWPSIKKNTWPVGWFGFFSQWISTRNYQYKRSFLWILWLFCFRYSLCTKKILKSNERTNKRKENNQSWSLILGMRNILHRTMDRFSLFWMIS